MDTWIRVSILYVIFVFHVMASLAFHRSFTSVGVSYDSNEEIHHPLNRPLKSLSAGKCSRSLFKMYFNLSFVNVVKWQIYIFSLSRTDKINEYYNKAHACWNLPTTVFAINSIIIQPSFFRTSCQASADSKERCWHTLSKCFKLPW